MKDWSIVGLAIEIGTVTRIDLPHPREANYEMTILDSSDLCRVMELQQIVIKGLSTPELFEPCSTEFIEMHLRRGGHLLGVTVEGELIAFYMMLFPGMSEDSLGLDLKLQESDLVKVAHLEVVAVHPSYRGNGIQRRIQSHLLRIAQETSHSHVCATVSIMNYPSLSNYLKDDFTIRALKEKYGNKMRYILYRDLRSSGPSKPQSIVRIMNVEVEEQREALAQDYIGFCAVGNSTNLFEVLYGK
jgi:GNAT superfamily N-acetyltransferase